MTKYKTGQRWTYKTRKQDTSSTLLIGKVEQKAGTTIVHVTVEEIVPVGTISHLPFSVEAIESSVLENVESDVAVSKGFAEGLVIWEQDNGGWFQDSVAKALDDIISAAPPVEADGFDQLVTEMRATKSTDLVNVLYNRVFSLDQWFFLCEPDDARVPVQWVFPEGRNTTPAILAFTSRERALHTATSIGIYPEGFNVPVMAPSVAEAVEWITGPGCENEWLCFNYTHQNFPLYVDQASQLFEAAKSN